jgi:hypothetical protein
MKSFSGTLPDSTLESERYFVLTADDGEEALEITCKFRDFVSFSILLVTAGAIA